MIAYLFPGQGSQSVGMGKDLYDSFESSRKIFDSADKILGFGLKELCFNGPQEQLTSTENAQPAILTTSIAALEALKEFTQKNNPSLDIQPKFVAGLSLGEYTALVAGGILSFEDAVCLVRKRGQYMEQAARNNPGKMMSIIGLSRPVIQEICKQSNCEIANLNSPEQIVISGKEAVILAAQKLAQEKGAKRAIILEVSGAFHCSLMKEAELKLSSEIQKVTFKPAGVPLVSNVTAKSEVEPATIVGNLIKQVSSSTFWEDSVRFMAGQGVTLFLEIGPGTVLRGLNRRIVPDMATANMSNREQVSSFVQGSAA